MNHVRTHICIWKAWPLWVAMHCPFLELWIAGKEEGRLFSPWARVHQVRVIALLSINEESRREQDHPESLLPWLCLWPFSANIYAAGIPDTHWLTCEIHQVAVPV